MAIRYLKVEVTKMSTRYLKIEVTKEMATDVYLRVDDADPQFAPVVVPPVSFKGGHKMPAQLQLTPALRALAERAARELDSMDWSDDDTPRAGMVEEVTKEEAEQYLFHDETVNQSGGALPPA